jgi:hypothetical protein
MGMGLLMITTFILPTAAAMDVKALLTEVTRGYNTMQHVW